MNAERGTRNAEQPVPPQARFDLVLRTKKFALGVIALVRSLPRGRTADVLGNQLLRSGTSVAANYRAARRARSPREFIAKMGIVEEEADESVLWLELLLESGLGVAEPIKQLHEEARQLVAITVASIRTARGAIRSVPRSAFSVPRSH